jgi:hypothetical protein
VCLYPAVLPSIVLSIVFC